MLRTVTATRYVTPLREGGSLPAVVEADDLGTYVLKFRGAGQGRKALVAELVAGELARTLGFDVPEIVLARLDPELGRTEPDPEIQDLLRASHGLNVGLRFLDGAFNFALPVAGDMLPPGFAARLVWLDALLINPDRTHHNPNLLIWNRQPWLIDHGAALYDHHDWSRVDEARARRAFGPIRQHVLLTEAAELEETDAVCAPLLSDATIREIMSFVPDDLLMDPVRGAEFESADAARERYVRYLGDRLRSPRAWVVDAEEARRAALSAPQRPMKARR